MRLIRAARSPEYRPLWPAARFPDSEPPILDTPLTGQEPPDFPTPPGRKNFRLLLCDPARRMKIFSVSWTTNYDYLAPLGGYSDFS